MHLTDKYREIQLYSNKNAEKDYISNNHSKSGILTA
jgi:hypothetical protein